MEVTYAASERNADAIVDVLRGDAAVLPRGAEGLRVLEVASGGGQHVVRWAREWPGCVFQPSDVDDRALRSVGARVREAALANALPPVRLDAAASPWPGVEAASFDVVCAVNMVHISPFAATQGLFRGAARALRPGGLVYLYGPFSVGGDLISDGNRSFDARLRAANPSHGIRDVAEVRAAASAHGFAFKGLHRMPANNHSLVFALPTVAHRDE